ncbi:TetR/AcrR family transcriptional regulator [Sandaracinobacteroides saxicola]|uniref:TetR/AcrR family transcriptional regulator n=1 Tax=Sandaracinobacteroides saxicola TaxID=2759707 RepID=A0A7G5IEH0_9SPHN|nr:TetR/AcrR family transcriptional regulator [Sandaracinobacteroides saxicola]QMW21762.1 TetR/AcrR family transcriptional regulator [Sandaracinobacteroides saxicola]
MTARLLSAIPDPTSVEEGEFRKSGETRRRILDAGMQILADYGYKKLSTPLVAERAGLTRAAMLYHFGSRLDLVTALVQHITRRRIEIYADAVRDIPHDQDFLARAIDLAWDQLKLPEFAAFTELSLAARSDPELAAIVRPAMAAFDAARRQAALSIFPSAVAENPAFDLRRDIVRFLAEGVMQQDGIIQNRAERVEALRRFLKLLASSREGKALLARTLATGDGD